MTAQKERCFFSSTLPNFEETLLEDGYADMYEIMKQFVRYDYDGVIHAHPWGRDACPGRLLLCRAEL